MNTGEKVMKNVSLKVKYMLKKRRKKNKDMKEKEKFVI